jgi:hypothetical protein
MPIIICMLLGHVYKISYVRDDGALQLMQPLQMLW